MKKLKEKWRPTYALEEHKAWTNVFLKEVMGAIRELSAVAAWVDSIFLIEENKNACFFVQKTLSLKIPSDALLWCPE